MSCLEAALGYAQRRWEVFPLHTPTSNGKCSCGNPECSNVGKHPRTPNGMKDATTDPAQIREWWTRWPDANIGRRPGLDDVVLDLDGPEGKVYAENKEIPITPTIATGKGIHVFFKRPTGFKVLNRAAYRPGLDIRTNDGYHILPPSLHFSGKRYSWIQPPETPLADCPRWLIDILRAGAREVKTFKVEGGEIPEGKRNETLFSMALRAKRDGIPDEAVVAMILTANQQICRPPIPEHEVKGIVDRAIAFDEQKKKRDATAAKEKAEKIIAKGYDRYLEFDRHGNAIKCHYNILVQDIVEAYDLITFTDVESVWVYDTDGNVYRDTGISTIKKFVLEALGEFFRKSFAEEVLYQAKIATYVSRGDMEPPPELLNLQNGILNVRTRELTPHTPKLFFINCSPTDYDPSAPRPYFDAMIKDFGCIKIDAVQEFTGYLLLDSPKHKKALLLSGPTDSGKTTFTNSIVNVIGKDSLCSIPVQRLDGRFQAQRLYKKRANLCGDLGAEAFKSIGTFNRTTGGDPIEAEVKGANKTLNFIWGGKHWYDVNDLPKAEGNADTDAYYNRLLMATFSKQIPKPEINKNLPEKLKLETSGILNWMLAGLDRLEKNEDFSDTTSIEEIKDHYKRGSDNIYCFTKDRCSIIEGEFVVKIESYRKYVTYCIARGYSPKGRSQFYEGLTKNLPAIKTDRRKVGSETPQVWLNLTISDEDLLCEDDEQKSPETPGGGGQPTNLTSFTKPTPYPGPGQPMKKEREEVEAGVGGAGGGYAGEVVIPVKVVGSPPESEPVQPVRVTLANMRDAIIQILEAVDYSVGRLLFRNLMEKAGVDPDAALYLIRDDPNFNVTSISVSYRPPKDLNLGVDIEEAE